MDKQAVVARILQNCSRRAPSYQASAFAASNIALCKYWGKRDEELNLPRNASLSLSLGSHGAFTTVKHDTTPGITADHYFLNGNAVSENSAFYKRLNAFLNLFRVTPEIIYRVETELNIPLASGFASSACGFAAITQALNILYDWHLAKRDLSILARLGSGSACRSLWRGFVEWHLGEDPSGMDSFAEPLPAVWADLRIGLIVLSEVEKSIPSREAMRHTVATSAFYHAVWQQKAADDLAIIKAAIAERDFMLLGETAEANAILMHATMMRAEPPIDYTPDATRAVQKKVRELRAMGLPVFFTQDAGPNLQLLFLAEHGDALKTIFPEMITVAPFMETHLEQVILVDENDNVIGVAEKMQAHLKPQRHRAFSIFILRQGKNGIEVLLQKRHRDKYHSGGLWSNSCCGHPRPDEDLMAAAERRLQEELDFVVPLRRVNVIHYQAKLGNNLHENEIDHILLGFADFEDEIDFNPAEVEVCRWVELQELQRDLSERPELYTVWLEEALGAVCKAL